MPELLGSRLARLAFIDLSDPDLVKSASLVRQASLDCGFFYVVNHGIGEDLFEELFRQSKKFFGLPQEEKMRALKNKNHRGYTPFFDETLNPDNQAKELLPGWREIMEKYHQEAIKVARRIAKLIALALNLDAEFFNKPDMLDEPIAILRLLHYAGEASNPALGIYGAGAHSDYGLMTLLATDSVPGLQICRNKNSHPQIWEDVPPLKEALIVNLGDMLERWSNGILRSTMHRVVVAGQERYSVAFFVEPSIDCVVECLPTCHSETNPPKYPPIKCEHYLAQKYQDTHRDLSSYHQAYT